MYFMSRSGATNRPKGVNGTPFPAYPLRESDGTVNAPVSRDPVQYDCQKNFIVMITDGEPTKDDFDNSNSERQHGARASRASRA